MKNKNNSTTGLEEVAFDFIRYANCWEDADVLLNALSFQDKNNAQSGKKFISIASAGDNSFSLLTTHPEFVVAVDVSEVQLHLVELKKIAFKELSYEELLCFLGFAPSNERIQQYHLLKEKLSPSAKHFWDNHTKLIHEGVVHTGKFERYFQLFSQKILPFIHSRSTVNELFRHKNKQEQERFYVRKWNSFRWRLLFKIFFSKYIMGKYGRDKAFLKEVAVPVGEFIFQQAENQLKSVDAQTNFILRYSLKGTFDDFLPHYLRKENYQVIKDNLDKLILEKGLIEEVLEKYGSFDGMNLSNIFEYLDEKSFESLTHKLVRHLSPNAMVVYWNLMVDRNMKDVVQESSLVSYDEYASELTKSDNGFFYKRLIINQMK